LRELISLTVSRKKTQPYVIFIDTTLKVDTYLYNKNDYRYHFYANINFKVSFDNQLNYVLHRDKASKHNNHDIRSEMRSTNALCALILMIGIWLVVVLLFWANRVASEQLQRWSKLCPPPQIECVTHSLFAFLLHNKRQMSSEACKLLVKRNSFGKHKVEHSAQSTEAHAPID
jgi:hypothetical protein